MPELPDVQAFRQYLNATALHQEIAGLEVKSDTLLEGTTAEELRSTLTGRSFASTDRHGKYLFVHLDDGRWLLLHFGMSGALAYFKEAGETPEYTQMRLDFTNGYHLAYTAVRKLGQIDLVESKEEWVEAKGLGPDALSDDLDLAAFRETVAGRRAMAKSTLMDQSKIAGIGNVYSDEILFQAGIHPRTQLKRLDEEEIAALYRTMGQVLRTAIEHQARPEEFPSDYLTPHRHPEGQCPICGEEVARVKVSGRSAYYCPNRQGQAPRGER